MLSLETEDEITLISKDKISFTLTKKSASLSGFLKTVMNGDYEVSEVEVDVETDVLKKIVEYLINHDGNPSSKIETPLRTVNLQTILSPWDFTFIETFDNVNLIKLVNASNYFNISCLLDLGCAKIATQVKNKKPDEIKRMFSGICL
jgi:hypothetical protein